MKLWILKHREDLKIGDNPFDTPYKKLNNFIIRAESESDARLLASEYAFEERKWQPGNPWLLHRYTTCDELLTEGFREVISFQI